MDKKSRIVKFSISIRRETQYLLDEIANDVNRSRSSLIDVICMEYCKKVTAGQSGKDKVR